LEHPFYEPHGLFGCLKEVHQYIADRTGSTPVYGFSEMLDTGDASFAAGRASGFMEKVDWREWLLRLSAKRGLVWKTAKVPEAILPKVSFCVSVGFGEGSPLPQPSGWWDIFVNRRFAVAVRVVNHSQCWRNGPCSFAFAANRIEAAAPFGSLCLSTLISNESRAAFGPAILTVPAEWVRPGAEAEIRVQSRCEEESARWFQLDFAHPSLFFESSDIARAVELLAGPRPKAGEYNVYFGDIHTHSGQVLDECANQGCGLGSREENYRFAAGPGGLDFYSLTDHENQIGPARAGEYLALADEYNREGSFVCLPGYEFTNLLYGHRNVYFRDAGGAVISTSRSWGVHSKNHADCLSPEELWDALDRCGVPYFTVPHHTSAASHPLTFEHFDERRDRLVEVYSCWGSSEYYGDFPRGVSDRIRFMDVQDAIRRGRRFGLIGSSDGHDGHPGDAQSPVVRHHHLFHFLGSGRAAVLAGELTRHAVFDALHARRCYATSGPPIVLNVTLDGAVMGSELPRPASKRPILRVSCIGANGIDHLRIVRNGRVVLTLPCHGEFTCDLEWEDAAYNPSTASSYYVRVVQKDRESAWSSPIWVGPSSAA
jgi:hypothetical protein